MLEGSSGVRKLHQEKINNLELIREEIRVVWMLSSTKIGGWEWSTGHWNAHHQNWAPKPLMVWSMCKEVLLGEKLTSSTSIEKLTKAKKAMCPMSWEVRCHWTKSFPRKVWLNSASRSSASKNHAVRRQVADSPNPQVFWVLLNKTVVACQPANQPTNSPIPPKKIEISHTKKGGVCFKKAPGSMIARTSIWWCLGCDTAPGSRVLSA